MSGQLRTHTCAQLRASDAGSTVTLCGFYENMRRVSRGLAFVVLRDFYGTTQLVLDNEEMIDRLDAVNRESTLSVTGTVRLRDKANSNMASGEIEVVPDCFDVLGQCVHRELPFEINRSMQADENTRLKYRYLDLRNPQVKDNLVLRSKTIAMLRAGMTAHGFMEITTPILTASSPEGARDYLVPSRNHPGQFYALPQAPQQFKQLLMVSGIDRYFQIAPCFRDEDARADRSPGEFYQLDMEMSFASQEDVFAVIEDVLPPVFSELGLYKRASEAPFTRIAYWDAMARYGSDKPDLRIDLELQDVTSELEGSAFEPFVGATIQAVVMSGFTKTRKFIDAQMDTVRAMTGNTAYWFKVSDDGTFAGGLSKHLKEYEAALTARLGLKAGDFVALAAGKKKLDSQKQAGVIRKVFGSKLENHFDEDQYAFCWIVDFPMYEIGEESQTIEFCHNPFSMPKGGMDALMNQEPLDIVAYQYDLVCNGIELSSGAVRNHEPEILVKAFSVVGLNEEDVRAKFPALYEAFGYGAPPHAGIAPGVDRMVMLLSGQESIREVIAFPMNKSAQDIMMGAPSFVDDSQLREAHICITKTEA